MIDVASADKALSRGPRTILDLYLTLCDYPGNAVRIRNESIERVGTLLRISFLREKDRVGNRGRVVYSIDPAERNELSIEDHVAVRIDGVWKVLNSGSKNNQSL